jgi:dipicolinate synthase subunit B
VANAALTAQGAAALLKKERPLTGARVLVLGWGRVGSLTAEALRREGASVTAAARRRESRTWAEARGFPAADTEALDPIWKDFDIIVNTVPSPILTEERLALTGPDVLLLELASDPGGIDAAAARGLGRRYLAARGLPGKYAPARAAELLRDAVYETMNAPLPRLGLAMTGSHCCLDMALEAFAPLRGKYDLVPIVSENTASADTRFGTAASFRRRLEALCGKQAASSVVESEPLGTAEALDILLVAPCTGNTLGKLAAGITDTAVTMACKAHLRNGRPLVLAISTNDGLSGSAGSIAALLQRKNVYFVPFRQDAPRVKPFSLQSRFDLLEDALTAAAAGRQLQPVLS